MGIEAVAQAPRDIGEVVETFDFEQWTGPFTPDVQARAIAALEAGKVLFFPHMPFILQSGEQRFLSPAILDGKSKNVSFDIRKPGVRGAVGTEQEQAELAVLMDRYARTTRDFVRALFPHYAPALIQARTSFRPAEISGRKSSYRKDDTRLHVDAFPSTPTQGSRILRVFANVNPDKGRDWRLGEPFPAVAERFLPHVPRSVPGSAWLMHRLGITRKRRTAYDHIMLHIHDAMKADLDYQANVQQNAFTLPPGASWMCYTDLASHAAMAGQHALEQSFYLPVSAMQYPQHSPLGVLEKLVRRKLV